MKFPILHLINSWQIVSFKIHYYMFIIKETKIFSKWLLKLKDIRGKVAIFRRIKRVKEGNFGDHKSVGDGVSELRITIGAGYRVYYTKKWWRDYYTTCRWRQIDSIKRYRKSQKISKGVPRWVES